MKKSLFTIVLVTGLSISINPAVAGSNNGYTTAANVYSGHSSLGWYGGGVAYRLAEWRKVDDVVAESDSAVSANPEDPASTTEDASTQTADDASTTAGETSQEAAVQAPEAPNAPEAPTSDTVQQPEADAAPTQEKSPEQTQ